MPPIPDGGLARAMPDWLREAPAPSAVPSSVPSDDPADFITADDLPAWLRDLGAAGGSPVSVQTKAPAAWAAAQPRPTASPTAPPPTPMTIEASTPPPIEPADPRAVIAAPLGRTEPPQPSDRRALVGVIGFVFLVLTVLVYLYASGML